MLWDIQRCFILFPINVSVLQTQFKLPPHPALHPLCISTVSHKWRSDGPEESKSSIFLDLLQRAVEEGKAIKLPSSD